MTVLGNAVEDNISGHGIVSVAITGDDEVTLAGEMEA